MQGPKWPLFYSHVDLVWSLLIVETGCILGRSPRTKETLPDFLWVVSGYPTSTSILRVDGLSTDPRVLGRHNFLHIFSFFFFNFPSKKKFNRVKWNG